MLKENQKLSVEQGDAKEFIDIVNSITSTLVFQFSIDEVCFIKIKNFFDHKWLNFSGKSVVHFESSIPQVPDASLQAEWREKLTVPPFNPNRVIHQQFVRKQQTGNTRISKHIHTCQESNSNIHNRMIDYTENGLFIWYSSDSLINKHASLMVYRIQEDTETWYASFDKRNTWKLNKTKGIRANELKAYLES